MSDLRSLEVVFGWFQLEGKEYMSVANGQSFVETSFAQSAMLHSEWLWIPKELLNQVTQNVDDRTVPQ